MNPLEYIYYLGYTAHKQYGLTERRRLDRKTISVGNLTVGGTGKTPLVMEIAKEAVKRGLKPCILTRGYRGSAGSSIVSRGDGPLGNWYEVGDEPFLMAEKTRGAWIIKDRNRYRGGLMAGGVDLFLLDDGFQYWPLERDVDILVLDATNPFGNGRLLPLGILREPHGEIKRADLILINKTNQMREDIEDAVRLYNNRAPVFYSYYRVNKLVGIDGLTSGIEGLRGRGVFAFSGVGSSEYFLGLLKEFCGPVTGSLSFRDHHKYTDADLRRIIKGAEHSGADIIVTTEKDLLKIRGLELLKGVENIYAMEISLEIIERKFYDIIMKDDFNRSDKEKR